MLYKQEFKRFDVQKLKYEKILFENAHICKGGNLFPSENAIADSIYCQKKHIDQELTNEIIKFQ